MIIYDYKNSAKYVVEIYEKLFLKHQYVDIDIYIKNKKIMLRSSCTNSRLEIALFGENSVRIFINEKKEFYFYCREK